MSTGPWCTTKEKRINEQLTVSTGYTLEERFMKDIPADVAFVNCVFYDGHQRHTIALLEFLNKNTSSDKRPPNPIKLKKD